MQIHPKVLGRAMAILEKSEDEILIEIVDITNKIVLTALFQQEQIDKTGKKRELILEILRIKLGLKKGEKVSEVATESVTQQYLNGVVESEEKTVIFGTNLLRDKAKETEEESIEKEEELNKENNLDSSTNNS